MSPTININDLVIVKEVKPEEIEVNDIITFGSTNSDNITTHRVKEIINENNAIKYVTQGDANNVEDPSPVQSDVLIGKVVKRLPGREGPLYQNRARLEEKNKNFNKV